VSDTVRDAMVTEPTMLGVDASAQEAGKCLEHEEMRAVFVVEADGSLVGVLTRKTLVREVVAAGRDPRGTRLERIAERPHYTIGPDVPLEEAFHFLEEHDAERVPVVDGDGRLVGVLSRSVLPRRLAEDEEPPEETAEPDAPPPAA
jgi:CBS domain-containing protein